jgi:integrase
LAATRVLEEWSSSSEQIFPVTDVAVRQAWDRLVKRAGITNLHFHDLRHEAISRFFEMGLSVPEVALISGHKDPRMLFRYTHLRAEDVVRKLG